MLAKGPIMSIGHEAPVPSKRSPCPWCEEEPGLKSGAMPIVVERPENSADPTEGMASSGHAEPALSGTVFHE